MNARYTVGLDYGTNSVRALDCRHGQRPGDRHRRLGLRTRRARGDSGTRSESGAAASGRLREGRGDVDSTGLGGCAETRARISSGPGGGIGGGHDGQHADSGGWAGSTAGVCRSGFAKNPAAMAWLWKDHTGVAEAAEITALAREIRPQYLAKCGGMYSSEWFFSKILHCRRTAPEVFEPPIVGWSARIGFRPC
jgi:L-ribulokinase